MNYRSLRFCKSFFAAIKYWRIFLAFISAVLLLSFPLPNKVEASAGDLDPTFGNGGKVITDFFGSSDQLHDMVIQSDGKILVAGIAGGLMTGSFALARYNTNGTLDSSFGSNGKVTVMFLAPISNSSASALALQPDGKIVVAGRAGIGNIPDFAIARLNSDGSLDTSFGNQGTVTTKFFGFGDVADDVLIQPDGKIVAVGIANKGRISPQLTFAIARYNNDGSLDSSFGTGGKVTTDFLGIEDVARTVTLQSDGKLVVAGYTVVIRQFPELRNFALARYNTNGTLDVGFGNGGKVTTDFFGQFDEANTVAIQPDGKIIAGGVASNLSLPSASDFALVRYQSDGTLDSTFGTSGKTLTDFPSEFDEIKDIAIQPDGKIVAVGRAELGDQKGETDFAIARYNASGNLDAGFGSNGKVAMDFFGFNDSFNAVAIQQDGKIIAAGYTDVADFVGDFAIVRFENTNFDICVQDDSSGNFLQLNSTTGEYQFNQCNGMTLTGTGLLTKRGCTITLQHNAADRRLLARLDTCSNKGSATIQLLSPGAFFTISDRNITNNSCACR